MAGNYMDEPGHRIAYDRDGSIVADVNALTGVVTRLDTASVRTLNDETDSTYTAATYLAVCFPIPMDLVAVFVRTTTTTATTVIETSKDSTNGLDGTWDDQQQNGFVSNGAVVPDYRLLAQLRTLIPGGVSNAVRAVRLRRTNGAAGTVGGCRAIHLYGAPAASATTDRLALWHPTVDVRMPEAHLDWGNVPRASTADKQFRIKNLSATLTAVEVNLYMESLTTASPPVSGMHTFSLDGGSTFTPSGEIAALAPGEISPVITLRRVVPANAQLSVWSARVVADVFQWSP